MFLRVPGIILLGPILAVFGMSVIVGCGTPAPEKPGDACDGDADRPCPEGTLCSGDEGNNRCMIPRGQACNAAEDYCWGSRCEDGLCSVGVNQMCDPKVGDMCLGVLVCSTSGSGYNCRIPPGYSCTVVDGSECTEGHTCAEVSGNRVCVPL